MMCQDIYNYICQNTKKNEDILSSMSNLQPNWCLKIDFQKVDQHAGGKVNPRHQTTQGQSKIYPKIKNSINFSARLPILWIQHTLKPLYAKFGIFWRN